MWHWIVSLVGFMDLNILMNTWRPWEGKDWLTPFCLPGTGDTEVGGGNPCSHGTDTLVREKCDNSVKLGDHIWKLLTQCMACRKGPLDGTLTIMPCSLLTAWLGYFQGVVQALSPLGHLAVPSSLIWFRCCPSLVAQLVKNLPVMQETQVWSLGWEDPLEKEMATHSSILVWRIPWTEEPGGLQSMGLHESETT